jgi:ring-1,2-phenylacetyl-CoA epoxidase subunit PaaD
MAPRRPGSPRPAAADPTDRVWDALRQVVDPEMPWVSIVDLGMVDAVEVEEGRVRVTLVPTYVGCPATDIIRQSAERQIAEALRLPVADVSATITHRVPWTTDRMAAECFAALRAVGVAPPTTSTQEKATRVSCPWCGSLSTTVTAAFGPTPCRSAHYCQDCKNVFEAIKPV